MERAGSKGTKGEEKGEVEVKGEGAIGEMEIGGSLRHWH